jgi:hypothetical protein
MRSNRRRTLRRAALAFCVVLLAWLVLDLESPGVDRAARSQAPRPTPGEAPPLSRAVGPSTRRDVPSGAESTSAVAPAAPSSVTQSGALAGALELRFRAREPLDCLRVSVLSVADERLESRAVLQDVAVFDGLPPGPTRVRLSNVAGESLVQADVEIAAGERAHLELTWPTPLPDRSAYTLSGVLIVPLLGEGVRGRSLQLGLEPLLDSPAQNRAFSRSRVLRLDQLRHSGVGRREFSFAQLEPGSYELRLDPSCAGRVVTLGGTERLVQIEFDPGPLGRPLIALLDESGAALRPAAVRASRRGEQLTGCETPLVYSPEFDAYDWLAVPGEWWLWVTNGPGGVPQRAARFESREGWSFNEVILGQVHCATIEIHGSASALALSEFEALPLDGGGVLEVQLVHDPGDVGRGQLLVWVDRSGHYELRRRTRGGSVLQLRILVSESAAGGSPIDWPMH